MVLKSEIEYNRFTPDGRRQGITPVQVRSNQTGIFPRTRRKNVVLEAIMMSKQGRQNKLNQDKCFATLENLLQVIKCEDKPPFWFQN